MLRCCLRIYTHNYYNGYKNIPSGFKVFKWNICFNNLIQKFRVPTVYFRIKKKTGCDWQHSQSIKSHYSEFKKKKKEYFYLVILPKLTFGADTVNQWKWLNSHAIVILRCHNYIFSPDTFSLIFSHN